MLRPTIVFAALALGVCLLDADPVAAQDRWHEQVTRQFTELDETARGQAMRVGSIQYGSLRQMETAVHTFRLRAGQEYAFAAFCDVDCIDLDLFVMDPDGRELDSDVSIDSHPVVVLTAPVAGDYRVRARMYSCAVEPCRYGVAVYQAGSGSTTVDRFSGALQEGAEALHRVHLNPGASYRFNGACDSDCRDLDIFIADPGGERIASDASVTPTPSVTVRPARQGIHEVRVRMYTCTVAPCMYEVTVTRD